MSSVSGNMKGFYRQKKNTNTNTKSSNKPPIHAATFGSDVAQPPSLASHGDNLHLPFYDDHKENETMLRQFDMNMAYGPCVGMSRKQRWERAQKLGLNPPMEIKTLLDLEDENFQSQSLWDGRI